MRIKGADLAMLMQIHRALVCHQEIELADRLNDLLNALKSSREKERESNRLRAEANRKAGYAWQSSQHPDKSKYYN